VVQFYQKKEISKFWLLKKESSIKYFCFKIELVSNLWNISKKNIDCLSCVDSQNIYLWRMKEGSVFVLFCLYQWDKTEPGWIRLCSWSLWKALVEKECIGLVFMAFGLAMQKFLNVEWFLNWKLNYNIAETSGGIGMCLWCSWKDLDEQDLMEFIW
jgi:hypothetical protein